VFSSRKYNTKRRQCDYKSTADQWQHCESLAITVTSLFALDVPYTGVPTDMEIPGIEEVGEFCW